MNKQEPTAKRRDRQMAARMVIDEFATLNGFGGIDVKIDRTRGFARFRLGGFPYVFVRAIEGDLAIDFDEKRTVIVSLTERRLLVRVLTEVLRALT